MGDDCAEQLWRREAATIARRVNSGWWLDRFNVLAAIALVAFSVLILCLRTLEIDWMETLGPVILLGILLAAAVLFAWLRSRAHFISSEEALVRLDDRLGLNNRLGTAQAGVTDWPEYRKAGKEALGLHWRWQTAWLPSGLSMLMVATAWLVPVVDLVGKEEKVVNEPAAWNQMEEWAATLEEEALIDPESLDEVLEKIEELRDQPSEEWYGHSSLEATDTLKEGLGRDIQELARDLGTIERDLEALRMFSSELSEAGRDMLLREMEDAMKNLAMNGLEINSELAKQLSEVDPSKLSEEMMKQLSSEQLKQLQDQLSKKCNGLGSMEGLPKLEDCENGMCVASSLMGASGSVGRGRGDAPIFFGDEDDLNTNNIQNVTNDDLSRASLGDLLGVGETEHEIDKLPSAVKAGGQVASKGKGGDAVWRESLVPEEQALLKRYFK